LELVLRDTDRLQLAYVKVHPLDKRGGVFLRRSHGVRLPPGLCRALVRCASSSKLSSKEWAVPDCVYSSRCCLLHRFHTYLLAGTRWVGLEGKAPIAVTYPRARGVLLKGSG
jgi:hypothetical protein